MTRLPTFKPTKVPPPQGAWAKKELQVRPRRAEGLINVSTEMAYFG